MTDDESAAVDKALCPHIVATKEGTAYCSLAESSVSALVAKAQRHEARIAILHQDNERRRAVIRRLYDTDQGMNLAISEFDFLAASVAVWREVDRLEAEGDYPGISQHTDLRKRERAAWEAYRASLSASRTEASDG